jgi:hypothetical protein
MHCASAALGDAATIFGAYQAQMVAKNPEEGSFGIYIVADRLNFAINIYLQHQITAYYKATAYWSCWHLPSRQGDHNWLAAL